MLSALWAWHEEFFFPFSGEQILFTGTVSIFFAEQLVAQFFLFFVGARHFSVCATFSQQTEEAGPRLPSYRPTKYGQAL